MLIFKLLQHGFDLSREGFCVFLLEFAVHDGPPLQTNLLHHRSLNFTIKIIRIAVSWELGSVAAHYNLTTINPLTLYLHWFFAYVDLPFVTQFFNLSLTLDFSHKGLHFFFAVISTLVKDPAHISHQIEVFAVIVSQASHFAQFRDKEYFSSSLGILCDH